MNKIIIKRYGKSKKYNVMKPFNEYIYGSIAGV